MQWRSYTPFGHWLVVAFASGVRPPSVALFRCHAVVAARFSPCVRGLLLLLWRGLWRRKGLHQGIEGWQGAEMRSRCRGGHGLGLGVLTHRILRRGWQVLGIHEMLAHPMDCIDIEIAGIVRRGRRAHVERRLAHVMERLGRRDAVRMRHFHPRAVSAWIDCVWLVNASRHPVPGTVTRGDDIQRQNAIAWILSLAI